MRGRLPLMRGSSDPPPGSATPGESATSGMKLRPSSGSVSICGLADVIAHGAAGGLQQRCFGVHFHRLRGLPDSSLTFEPDLVADAQRDALLPVRAEARLLDCQARTARRPARADDIRPRRRLGSRTVRPWPVPGMLTFALATTRPCGS